MALALRNEGTRVNSNINVTPMVDVMLVLLIIFMVITPMLQKDITVDLAKVNNPEQMTDADKEDAMVVAVTRDASGVSKTRPMPREPGAQVSTAANYKARWRLLDSGLAVDLG